ncbi:hypothetical protein AMECASPLE_014429 [Ameca splendens]|uniref:Uncharacterized protein n=1 Tax=Ameca splendens TaxID=208324 RepID=A0ABV0YCL2_9TELE
MKLYDSVVVLDNLLDKNRGSVHMVMTQLKLQTFTDLDVGFLTEDVQDVKSILMRLKKAKSKNLLYCSPYVDALLAGIRKRFGLLLEDQECHLAAVFHPKFHLFWLEQFISNKFSLLLTIKLMVGDFGAYTSLISCKEITGAGWEVNPAFQKCSVCFMAEAVADRTFPGDNGSLVRALSRSVTIKTALHGGRSKLQFRRARFV